MCAVSFRPCIDIHKVSSQQEETPVEIIVLIIVGAVRYTFDMVAT